MIEDILRIQMECGIFGSVAKWISGASFAGGGSHVNGWEDDDLYTHPTSITKRRLSYIINWDDRCLDRWQRSYGGAEDDLI